MTIEELQAQVAQLTGERDAAQAQVDTLQAAATANAEAATRATELEAQLATSATEHQAALEAAQTEALATLRGALVTAHGLDENATALLTATDAVTLQSQVAAVTALRATTPKPASSPLMGTYTPPVEDEGSTFVTSLFGQS